MKNPEPWPMAYLKSSCVLTVATAGSTTLMSDSVSFSTSANSTFTNVNAVGYFAKLQGDWLQVTDLELTESKVVSSYDFWAGLHNLTGDDALGTSDPDEDGLDNDGEFAYGGDPNDELDQGGMPEMTADALTGTNGFYYTYIKSRDPSTPYAYEFQTTDNLVATPFANNPSDYVEVGEGVIDYYWTGVTNFVPSDDATKFMRVDL